MKIIQNKINFIEFIKENNVFILNNSTKENWIKAMNILHFRNTMWWDMDAFGLMLKKRKDYNEFNNGGYYHYSNEILKDYVYIDCIDFLNNYINENNREQENIIL